MAKMSPAKAGLIFSACQKSPHRTFLTALSAGHIESVQNAVAESLKAAPRIRLRHLAKKRS